MTLLPPKLSRFTAVAALLLKYGRMRISVDDPLAAEREPAVEGDHSPETLAADLERLGPTFIKLGQVLSTRADLLPKPYLDALARLQDKVQPFSIE